MMIAVAWALARREFLHFVRQPQRLVGTVAQPVLFWLFLGSGFSASFKAPGIEHISYLEYFYPGVMLMMTLFASIFSSITIIEDRDAGFLQSVLVAPTPRTAIVLGKVLGGTLIALVQTVILTLAAPFLGLSLSAGSLAFLGAGFVVASVGFSAMGFFFAWSMRSSSGFHAVMMVFLMPLWMLSGALFPVAEAPLWLRWLMDANPVSHALTLIRDPFYMTPAAMLADPDWRLALTVSCGWALLCLAASIARVGRRDRGQPA